MTTSSLEKWNVHLTISCGTSADITSLNELGGKVLRYAGR